jgi:hypothetical protein
MIAIFLVFESRVTVVKRRRRGGEEEEQLNRWGGF